MATKSFAQEILVLARTEELEVQVAVSFFPSHDTGRTEQQAYSPFQQTSSNGIDTEGEEHKASVLRCFHGGPEGPQRKAWYHLFWKHTEQG